MNKLRVNQKFIKIRNIFFIFMFLIASVGSLQSQAASFNDEPPPVKTIELPDTAFPFDSFSIPINSRTSRNPKLDSTMSELAATQSRTEQKALIASGALRTSGDQIHVQIVTYAEGLQAAISAVNKAGGEVTKVSKQQDLLQGWLPINAFEAVASQDEILLIRRPSEAILLENTRVGNQTTEGLAAINGDAWHTNGYEGAGVNIAVIDGGFLGYDDLLETDLPDEVWVENFVDGETYLDVDGTTEHGTACAEIIHDIAPEAYLYLLKIGTDLDLEQAVDWIIANVPDMDIISTSLGFFNLTPGDGTGKFEDLVQETHDAGMLWITAGGNDRLAHWGGSYRNNPAWHLDNDNTHYFDSYELNNVNYYGPGNGDAYLINPGIHLTIYLRWDDWTDVTEDYDLYLVRWNVSDEIWEIVASSENPQNGGAAQTPTEWIYYETPSQAPYGFIINRANSDRDVNFEVFAPQVTPLNYIVHDRSLQNLADAPTAMTVAALDVNNPYPFEDYSAQGPTNGPGGTASGGSIKPDISAFANVNTVSYGTTEKFNGTSSATPHVAGAAALVKSAYPTISLYQLRLFLESNAIDMGATGNDTMYGYGRLYLGDAPAPETPPAMPNANDSIIATAVQPDGKILIGGYFTQVDGETRNHIARLNPDGNLDTSFNPNINGRVDTIAIQLDGEILVGGAFNIVGSYTRNHIARLQSNGSVDTAFDPNANGTVRSILIQSNGEILIGGDFTQISTFSHGRIARLETNGTVDNTFNPSVNNVVRTLAVQDDGKILIGGAFTEVNSKKQDFLARLNQNGSLDEDFSPELNGYATALLLRPDDTMLLGGEFTAVNGELCDYFVWLDSDGLIYPKTTFPDVNDHVLSIGLQADGKILLGGYFTEVDSESHNHIVRLEYEGGVDGSFSGSLDADNWVLAVGLQKDGTIIAGGAFSNFNGAAHDKIVFHPNNIYSIQALSVSRAGPTSDWITWRLRHASPEVYRATFELSTNGTNYSMLGEAYYSQGNWVMGNLSLPKEQDIWVRARGYYGTGRFNSSGSILESILKTRIENQPPTDILLSNHYIDTNQPVNTLVGVFSTIDPDIGDSFTYQLVDGLGSIHNSFFNISENQLRTAKVFTSAFSKGYTIRVRSTDNGGLWVEKQFTILFENVVGNTFLPLIMK